MNNFRRPRSYRQRPKTKASKENALDFMDEVEVNLNQDKETFSEFCQLMKALKGRRIHVTDAISLGKEILSGHPSLLARFNVFLPTQSEESEIKAYDFLAKVKENLNPEHYRGFIVLMREYKNGQKTINTILEEVSSLFDGHEDLMSEFRTFYQQE